MDFKTKFNVGEDVLTLRIWDHPRRFSVEGPRRITGVQVSGTSSTVSCSYNFRNFDGTTTTRQESELYASFADVEQKLKSLGFELKKSSEVEHEISELPKTDNPFLNIDVK